MALGPFYVADKLRSGKGIRGTALLMRHGETAWNRVGRVMGHNPIELDGEGRAQVELAVPAARVFRNARVEVLAETGHIGQMERPGIVAARFREMVEQAGMPDAGTRLSPDELTST